MFCSISVCFRKSSSDRLRLVMSLKKPVKCVLAVVYEFPEGNFDFRHLNAASIRVNCIQR